MKGGVYYKFFDSIKNDAKQRLTDERNGNRSSYEKFQLVNCEMK